MGARTLFHERRGVGRPRNGDEKPCPRCGDSACEFNERYRFPEAGIAPAWICESPQCRYREIVRAEQRTIIGESVRRSRALQARVKRRMMKIRSLTERSRKTIAKTQGRLDKKD